MERQEMERLWETFFAKYKKTEGDGTTWWAPWRVWSGGHTLEMLMSRCPQGTRFRLFVDGQRVEEVEGFDGLWAQLATWEKQFPGVFVAERFFAEMAEALE